MKGPFHLSRASVLLAFLLILVPAVTLISACKSDPVSSLEINITGGWTGSWTAIDAALMGLDAGGEMELTLVQTGNSVTGSVTLTGSDCFTGGDVSGTMVGVWIGLETVGAAGLKFELLGLVATDGTSMTGSTEVSGGDCQDIGGMWELTRR